MAHQYLRHINGKDTDASAYVDRLQEFLSAERCNLVRELQSRPDTNDDDGCHRMSVIVQYEAWCREFQKETVEGFLSSSLAREAV